MTDCGSLQRTAEADGRRCVVGALILDDAGRAFVHRRGWDRRLLPGCWDIVGGHVESGENLIDALAREVEEETGWSLTGAPSLAYVGDWESIQDGAQVKRREFDFLVQVSGDLNRPRLERPKHIEFRWIDVGDIELLDENRGRDDGMVRRLVELALRSSQPHKLRYWHATAFITPAESPPIEELRSEWDPAMAEQIAAHVTVIYPSEITSANRLTKQLAEAAERTAPFRLRLGHVRKYGIPGGGIFIEVHDLDCGWSHVRELVLGSSAYRSGLEPHVTLVHPRTTNRSGCAWQQLEGAIFGGVTLITDLAVTAFDGYRWDQVHQFDLRGI